MRNALPYVSLAAMMIATPALAQSNLEKLGAFKTTGVTEFETVAQSGDFADGIRETLKNVNLPAGFKIELYAVVPDARHMAVGPQGIVTFVGTRKTSVWSVTDRNKDRIADEVKSFAPSIDFAIPNGPCFSEDGFLYIAEQNRVLVYPAAEFFYESPDVAAFEVVAEGNLIPPEEESYNHTARVCKVGPDDKLYISLGQPFNVPPPEKLELYNEVGIGGMIRMNRDGTQREVYTYGIRNSVGHDFNPANGEHFGFPWYGGGDTRTNEYADSEPPADAIFPAVNMVAHAADLGMHFYQGSQFPAKYRGGIFSAQHGSWNRTTPVGARVMFTGVNEDGSAGETEVFADGWIDANGEYLGRPVDVAELRDGSILVSDDLVGAIYRISYGE